MIGRMGRPGLIGTAARTAVIAGTAQATTSAMQRRQAARQQQAYDQQQAAALQQQAQIDEAARQAAAQYQQVPPPAPSMGGNPMLDQLQQLGTMHASGLLTDAEFAAAKAKLLAN